MADQKTEDSISPLGRRGARPFAGPTGAPGAGRPFVRPATTQRPTAAPFVPPVAPAQSTLGNAPAPAARAATPVATQPVPSATDDPAAPRSRPVTSETVAVDAIDAFDTVWGTPAPSTGAIEPDAGASRLEESSLGGEIDSQPLWAEEIVPASHTAAASEIAPAEPVAAQDPAATDTTHGTPAEVMPAWLEDNASSPTTGWPGTAIEAGDVVGEWTDTHTIPSSDEIMGMAPVPAAAVPGAPALGDGTCDSADWMGDDGHDAPDSPPRFELVEEPRVETPEPAPMRLQTVDTSHEARIAAALDRLADRVRSGEIDVSSIAPDATDAGMLASMLAALLGGSRSR